MINNDYLCNKITFSMVELRIKEILKKRNMTAKSLAESMGKTPQYINSIINGGKGASLKTLEEVAKHLDVPISSLFADYNSDKSNASPNRCPYCGKELKIRIE